MDIIVKNLCKKYGDNKVLENYSEVFREGRVSVLMGPSGIGKTTLMRILCGLEKADSGTIENIEGKRISVVFQDDSLCLNLSVMSNLKLVCDNINPEYAEKTLEQIGLKGYENKRVRELSGGMKRRVAILRAVLYGFDILIMDEPFKGLDTYTRDNVIDFLKEHIKDKTVIMITHNEEEIKCFENCNVVKM